LIARVRQRKPIRIRMMPPTIRTMLSGTSKISSSSVPKIRKKNSNSVAEAFAAYLAPLMQKNWFVYAKPPFAGPQAVLAYLARYTHRVGGQGDLARFNDVVRPIIYHMRAAQHRDREALIAELERNEHAKLAVEARALLTALETSLRLMREDLARIEKESRGSGGPD